MSVPINAIITGSFTSAGTALNLRIPSQYQDFELINLTDIGSTSATQFVMKARGTSLMTAGSAYVSLKSAGAATLALENTITTGGFTFVSDSADTAPGSAVSITSATNASPVVVTASSAAGLSNGDVVRITNSTGQLNIAGLDFTIGNVNIGAGTFELSNMSAPGAVMSAGFYRRIPFDPAFYPARRIITNISAASSALITMSVTHGYVVGQLVRIYVPAGFGMTQINGLLATITAVGTADTNGFTNTITVNINSTAFTAFSFPSSATAALGISFPEVVPVGEAATAPFQNLLDDATRNTSFNGIIVGTGVQTSGKLYQWFARTGVSI